MTGGRQSTMGDQVASTHALDDVRPGRADAPSPPASAFSNVIPFVRPHRDAEPSGSAPEIAFVPADRPAPTLTDKETRARILGLLALSLLVHSGLYIVFNREPEPMPSIGLESISVEIVLGANSPAGVAATPGQEEAQSAPLDDPNAKPEEPDTTTAKVEETKPPEAKPVEPEETRTETAVTEAPREQSPPEPVEPPTPSQQTAALPVEETAAPREPELTVTLPDPEKPAEVKPELDKPVTVKPEPKPEPKPAQKRELKPKQVAKPKQERPAPRPTRTASRQPEATGPRSSAASGVGRGSSPPSANYAALVAGHLARHKRYPADSRGRGEQGSAMVSFALDGGGRVTRVALVRGSGHASLDHEVQSMVRRASPFPAPPDGRAHSFTVPVSFRFQ